LYNVRNLEKPRHDVPWKRKRRIDDVSMTDRRVGGGHAPAKMHVGYSQTGKRSAMFAGRRAAKASALRVFPYTAYTYRNIRRTGTRCIVVQMLQNANFGQFHRQTSTACVSQVPQPDPCRSHRCRWTPLRA